MTKRILYCQLSFIFHRVITAGVNHDLHADKMQMPK